MAGGRAVWMPLVAVAAVCVLEPAPVDVRRSVVALAYRVEGTLHVVCSGAVLALLPVPVIATESHCLHPERGTVYLDGIPAREWLRLDEYALVVPDWRQPHWWPLDLARAMPAQGAPVVAWGWAFGEFLARAQGTVAGECRGELFLDLNVIRGMSGGPILDADGRLVCLVRGVQSDGTPLEPMTPNGLAFCGTPGDLTALFVMSAMQPPPARR